MATALYRRYRPETFAEVIGQQHVTDPLRAALRAGRANHAYLFSGPRGCGKTTSARILARCLNCAQGPTDTPCGVCDSCVELARGGSGSLDVVEIDAASHGGVDDARELRERAAFAPARDRFKVYIIDEAHMVTPQGFNALLKIVEEPPEHIMFVFATTEPDKVLGTIRSRTHHYPFHLVPPPVLASYLQQVCDAEGVAVGKGVLPLVVRAGAGSVRDSLSVLDQLAAGSGAEGIDYERAVSLLGYTHATLLDDVVAAFAAGDGATVFRVVDRVITSGQDPRRFVDDLLQRLRDLVVVQAVAERAHEVFPGTPVDQLERMAVQAAAFGAASLSRAADLANTASTEMTGATSPRLHLELLCARMLLPAADDGERGLAARLDRLERRLSVPVPGAPLAPEPAAPRRAAQTGAEPAAAAPAVEPVPVPEPVPIPAAVSAPEPSSEAVEAVRRMWPDILEHLASAKRRTWTRVSQDAQVHAVDERQVVLSFSKPGTMVAFMAGPHADAVRESLIAVLGLDRVVVAVAGDTPVPATSAPAVPREPSASQPASVRPAPLPQAARADPPSTPRPVEQPPTAPAPERASAPSRASESRPAASSGRPAPGARRPVVPPELASAFGPGLPPEPPDDDEPYPPDDQELSAPAPRAGEEPSRSAPTHDSSRPQAPSPAAPAVRAQPPVVPAPPAATPPAAQPALRGADLVRSAVRSATTGSPAGSSSTPAAAPAIDDEPSYDDEDADSSPLVGAAVAEHLLGGRIIAIEERR